jgi:hypothetical protein
LTEAPIRGSLLSKTVPVSMAVWAVSFKVKIASSRAIEAHFPCLGNVEMENVMLEGLNGEQLITTARVLILSRSAA